VGRDERGDDRQAEAGAAGAARCARRRPGRSARTPRSASPGPCPVPRRRPGARARPGRRRLGHGHRHPASGRGVGQRVGDQVADDLPQPALVPEHDRDVGERLVQVQRDRPVGLDGLRVVDGVTGDRGEVDRRERERTLLVEPGEQQRSSTSRPHAGALGLDPSIRRRTSSSDRTAPCRYSSRTRGSSERRPQLVAGVGTNRRIRVLRAARLLLRRLLRAEGGLDPGQHPVERRGQPPDLGALVALRHPRERSPAAMAPGRVSTSASGRRLLRTRNVTRGAEDGQHDQPGDDLDRDELARSPPCRAPVDWRRRRCSLRQGNRADTARWCCRRWPRWRTASRRLALVPVRRRLESGRASGRPVRVPRPATTGDLAVRGRQATYVDARAGRSWHAAGRGSREPACRRRVLLLVR
jgi:hypothetical protein